MPGFGLTVVAFAILSQDASAQQPFVTDDADVTAAQRWHLEISNQLDWLKDASFPNLRQNAAEVEVNYGLLPRLELGVALPLLAIFNAAGTEPRTATGIGDTNISVKWRARHSATRMWAISGNLEIPTGDRASELGSGVADFGVNGIWQERLSEVLTLRGNAGLLFSGNTLTGAVGIPGRGLIVTGGSSLVRQVSPRLGLGIELATAFTPQRTGQAKAQLQWQAGGNYLLRDGVTLDAGVLGGWFEASPALGVQVGASVDF